jgi:hypothetical protein
MSRDFVPLPPPPDGLAAVVTEGRRRRRRRRQAVGGSAGGAALAVVVAVAALTGAGARSDTLQPAPFASAGPVVPQPTPAVLAPTAAAQPTTQPRSGRSPGAPAVPGPPGPGAGATAPAAVEPSAAAPPSRPAPADPQYRTPDLQRSYVGPPQRARLCGAAYSNQTQPVPWCISALAVRTAEGADLVVEVCRDGASAGQLTFATDHEVDLVVREGDRELWRWSVGRTPVERPHALEADAGGCWSWRAPWTGVDQQGKELDGGRYVLGVRSQAEELSEAGEATADLTL